MTKIFSPINFDAMRAFIYRQPAKNNYVKHSRLVAFDRYRYEQNYEKIYSMIKHFGGIINFSSIKE